MDEVAGPKGSRNERGDVFPVLRLDPHLVSDVNEDIRVTHRC